METMAPEPEAVVAFRRALGEKLATFRLAAQLTQGMLAKAAFCDRTTVAHIEKGRSRADERFWRIADERCQAAGVLLGSYRELEVLRHQYEHRSREIEVAKASAKAAELRGGDRESSPPPWETTDVMRRLHRTSVGAETVEQVEIATEELCCEYAWRDADELRAEARHYLRYISRLLDGACTLREHRDLLVQAGWLMLLTGCVDYDLGRTQEADRSRAAALRLGRETGHGEIMAWSFEMSAWFALTKGRLDSVARFAEAGSQAAPNTSVVVQLSAQSAKAAARMGHGQEVSRILDDGYRLLGKHERPTRPENHFVIDPRKWDFYAMDCYRFVGEDKRAAEHAHEVLRVSRRPDGTDRSPMRATEARLTLATVALRQGDLDSAGSWTRRALSVSRRSVEQLAMVAAELERELHRLFPDDPATRVVTEPIDQARAELSG